MRTNILIVCIVFTILSLSCQSSEAQKSKDAPATAPHKIVVQEVLQASAYTYIKVKEGDKDYWMAMSKGDPKVGGTYYYQSALEMKDFTSRDLSRTFDTIYFVQAISDSPVTTKKKDAPSSPHGKKNPVVKTEKISVEPAKGGITIAELFSHKDVHSGKTVKVRGQVTKFNANIMGKNWLHLQDGTEASGDYDLTVTTKDEVKVGDIVTFEGKISLNKDFGAGYAYKVIMEDAQRRDGK